MHLTSSPRRALGLLAAGTIGPSTALLGVTGVAQATQTAPPEAPTIDAIEGDDQTLHVFFLANFPAEDDVVTAWADSWEYNLDGDGWEAAVDVDISGGYGHFEVDGLTNDQEYSVEVRGVDGVLGVGAASEAEPGTPYKSIGAPGTPSVQVVGSSLTITWAAPTAGTYPLTGYRVGGYVSTVDGGGGEIELCRTGAAVLTCTIAVTPGNSYVVFVNAIDAEDHYGWESDPAASTGPIPKPAVPSTVPTKDGDLTGPAGSGITTIVPGKTVVLKGTGFLPNSTVTAIVYSAPQQLATFVTDGTGSFEYTVTIPEGLEAGQHSLVVTGVGANGAVRNLRVDVTVAASGTTVVTAAKLAATGADVTGPMIGGLAALAAGAGLIVASRRRTAA